MFFIADLRTADLVFVGVISLSLGFVIYVNDLRCSVLIVQAYHYFTGIGYAVIDSCSISNAWCFGLTESVVRAYVAAINARCRNVFGKGYKPAQPVHHGGVCAFYGAYILVIG